MLNKVILIGNLVRDPSLIQTKDNKTICNFSIAVNTKISKDKTEMLFVDVVSFGKRAENIAKFFKKGNPILVEGRLVLNMWVDKNGQKRFQHKVALEKFSFVGSSSSKQQNNNYMQQNNNINTQQNYAQSQDSSYNQSQISGNTDEVSEEDIPF